jgi:hypothetical protein
MSKDRATRYWRLALQEPDVDKAAILLMLADEAERGVLCAPTTRRVAINSRPYPDNSIFDLR